MLVFQLKDGQNQWILIRVRYFRHLRKWILILGNVFCFFFFFNKAERAEPDSSRCFECFRILVILVLIPGN